RQAPYLGCADGISLASFVFASLLLLTSVARERRSDHPMLPIEEFSDRRFSAGAAGIALTVFAMFGLFFISTQYLHFVHGYSPLRAGVALLPMAALMVLTAPRSAS